MKDTINILFVCGYGVGSSVMLQTVVKKALTKYEFKVEMEHTAAGGWEKLYRLGGYFCYFQKLLDVVSLDPKHGQYLIPIENIMDGETIGAQIYEVVQQHFPHLLNK